MARGHVNNSILDGALGVQPAASTGIFGAVGVAAAGYGQGILILTTAADAQEKLLAGPLRDLIVSALSLANTTVYAVPLLGTVDGVVSAVLKAAAAAGTGSMTVAGLPRNDYDVSVEIKSGGGLNEASAVVTVDGIPSARFTIAEDGQYVIAGTGLTLTFVAGAEGISFAAGDVFTFSTSAPAATNAELLAGIDTLLESSYAFEWIAVAGITDAAMWAALATKATGAEAFYRYIHFKAQARYLDEGETIDQWVAALTGDERGLTVGGRVQVYAAHLLQADPFGATDVRGAIGLACGMSARRDVQEPVDAVRNGSVSGVVKLLPEGINGGHIDALDNAGYATLTTYIGLTGAYITHGRMFAEGTSDYGLEERRRVMDLACHRIRTAQLMYLNDTVSIAADGSMEGIEMFKAISQQVLNDMAAAGQISAGEIEIDPNQNILSTETIETRVKIVPLGKMTFIENVISYANPVLEEE